MITLYKISKTGSVCVWSISSDVCARTITVEYGVLNGAMQTHSEVVAINKSGRSLIEQINLLVESKINKQIDKGYRHSIEDARQCEGKNILNMYQPMLAKVVDKVSNIDYNKCFYQYKYNGNRCLITRFEDEVVAYSRRGKIISSIPHIISTIDIEEGQTLDGELYIHGVSVQQLGSLIRKQQPDSVKLKFVCYDMVSKLPFNRRMNEISAMNLGPFVEVAKTGVFKPGITSVSEEMAAALENGYEGIMLRQGDTGYEPGVRSSSLLKVKPVYDAEFMVIDVQSSKDDWAVLVCRHKDKTFKVCAPGTLQQKFLILEQKHLHIGKYVNVEFREFTDDGLPFHAVATRWITQEDK